MDNQKLVVTAGYALTAGLLACAAAAYTDFVQVLLPSWRGGYLPWLALAVILETLATRRRVQRELEGEPFSRRLVFHAFEWLTIALVVRLVLTLVNGLELLPTDLARWQANPLDFFSGEFGLVMLALLALAWVSSSFADDLEVLEMTVEEIKVERAAELPDHQPEVRRQVASRILFTGGGLVLVTALARMGLGQFWAETPQARLPVLTLSVYFGLGLALLSLIHFAGLRKRWVLEDFTIHPGLGRGWLGWALAFFGVSGLLAWLLPTRYTHGLLDLLGRLLGVLMQFGGYLFLFVHNLLGLLFLPFEWLMRLLGLGFGPEAPQPRPTPAPPPPETAAAPLALPWLDLLKSVLFWLALGGMAAAALYYGLRQNAGVWQRLGRAPWLVWLGGVLGRLRRGAGRINRRLVQAVVSRLRKAAARSGLPRLGRAPGLDWRRLDARRRVIHVYLDLLQRTAAAGLGRKPAQTPGQYRADLRPRLEAAQDELDLATGAFIEARYSAHPLSEEQAGQAAAAVERVEQALGGQN